MLLKENDKLALTADGELLPIGLTESTQRRSPEVIVAGCRHDDQIEAGTGGDDIE